MRLLHGALVILVRLQISQFRSVGKWVSTLCLPKSSRLFVVRSKEASWEELAWEPPCNGISSSTKFPWILATIPGSQNHHTGFAVLSWFPFYLVLGFCWLGFPQVPWSIINQLSGTGEMSLLDASSLSRTGISPTVGEFLCIEFFRMDFRCVHRFQLLKVCDQYVTLPNSPRVQSVSEEQSR